MARYVVEFQADNYDEPDMYNVLDTKLSHVVTRIYVPDFQMGVTNTVEAGERKKALNGELAALEMALLIAEKLEVAAEQGEVL